MKKYVYLLSASLLLLVLSCKQGTTSVTTAASKASFANSGSDVDLLKKMFEAYAKADWATYRSCFQDSAFSVYNQMATDSNLQRIPVDTVVAHHSKDREVAWEGMDINRPIYEVVTDTAGNKYGHVWCKLSTKNRKIGKKTDVTIFGSYGLKNDKVAWEWVIFDRLGLQ